MIVKKTNVECWWEMWPCVQYRSRVLSIHLWRHFRGNSAELLLALLLIFASKIQNYPNLQYEFVSEMLLSQNAWCNAYIWAMHMSTISCRRDSFFKMHENVWHFNVFYIKNERWWTIIIIDAFICTHYSCWVQVVMCNQPSQHYVYD